jgi:hypothetical protein
MGATSKPRGGTEGARERSPTWLSTWRPSGRRRRRGGGGAAATPRRSPSAPWPATGIGAGGLDERPRQARRRRRGIGFISGGKQRWERTQLQQGASRRGEASEKRRAPETIGAGTGHRCAFTGTRDHLALPFSSFSVLFLSSTRHSSVLD